MRYPSSTLPAISAILFLTGCGLTLAALIFRDPTNDALPLRPLGWAAGLTIAALTCLIAKRVLLPSELADARARYDWPELDR